MSRHLCVVARVEEPTYCSHRGNCRSLFVGSGVQGIIDNVSKFYVKCLISYKRFSSEFILIIFLLSINCIL